MAKQCFQTTVAETHTRQALLKCRSHATGNGDMDGLSLAVQLVRTSQKCQLKGLQVHDENVSAHQPSLFEALVPAIWRHSSSFHHALPQHQRPCALLS